MLFRNKSKTFLRFLLIENGLDMLTTAMEEAHIVFGCKDKGFMGIWYTTGKVLTKKHAYYCKISIFAKT